MAFTKILGPGIHTLANFHSHNINSSGIITATKFVGPLGAGVTGDGANFAGIVTCTGLDVNGDGHVSGALTVTGNVNIGGTITYTDVTNIDAVGIITAQSGINISGNGLNVISGVSTFAGDIDANADIELAGNLAVTGVSTFTGNIVPSSDSSTDIGTNGVRFQNVYADTLYGDGSNLTGISGVSVANQADNRLITATGTTDALNGESGLTYDGSTLGVTGDVTMTNTSSNPQLALISANNGISEIQFGDGADAVRGNIIYRAGSAGDALCFNGYNNTESLRIDSAGRVQIGHTGSLVGGRVELHRAAAETWMTINESSDSGTGPALYINRTRGSSLTSPTPVTDGNWLGNVYFGSYDTNSYEIGARIAAAADGQTWADGDCPARLMFYTTPDAGTTPEERIRINAAGDVCINQSGVIDDAKLSIKCDATQPAIGIQANHTNTDTKLISAWNSSGKNIVNITAESDNSPYIKFQLWSTTTNTAVERFRVNHLGNVAIGGGTAASNNLEITQDPKGFPSDSAQPNASLLIKHGTSGSNRRWVGIGASLTGAWIQSSSPGGSGLAAPLYINKGGGEIQLGNNKAVVKTGGDFEIPDGNLVIGTAGHGIDFSAQTPASATGQSVQSGGELLDHYECGNWTPVLKNTSNTPTWYNQIGKYVRIGKIVHLWGFMQIGATKATFSNTSSAAVFGGIPIAPSNGVGYTRTCGGAVTSQKMLFQGGNSTADGNLGGTYNDYGANGVLNVDLGNGGDEFRFNVSGHDDYRGTLRNACFHDVGGWIFEFYCSYALW